MKKAKIKGYKKIRTPLFLGWGIRALFRVGLRMLITCLPLLSFIAIGVVFFCLKPRTFACHIPIPARMNIQFIERVSI